MYLENALLNLIPERWMTELEYVVIAMPKGSASNIYKWSFFLDNPLIQKLNGTFFFQGPDIHGYTSQIPCHGWSSQPLVGGFFLMLVYALMSQPCKKSFCIIGLSKTLLGNI